MSNPSAKNSLKERVRKLEIAVKKLKENHNLLIEALAYKAEQEKKGF